MKHITPGRLTELDGLLQSLRGLDGLKEKKPGVFYRKSKAFLHFHEHGDELFADVRLEGADFSRFPVTKVREQTALLSTVKGALR